MSDDNTKLAPFESHGVEFTRTSGDEAYGKCPFTGKDSKFYVNRKTGLWHSKTLGEGGNVAQFLERMNTEYQNALTPRLLRTLAKDRRLPVEALQPWGIGWSGKAYTLPHRDARGVVVDIRTYRLTSGKRQFISTKGARVGLFGAEHLRDRRDVPVYVCEGEWDAIAWTYVLHRAKRKGVVVGMPGAGVFKEEWAAWLRGRDVRVMLDHDEAGRNGDALVLKRLRGIASGLRFLHWPADTPDGHDIRDEVADAAANDTYLECWRAVKALLQRQPRIEQADSESEDRDDVADKLVTQYVYSVGTKRFINVNCPELQYDKEQFDAFHAVQHPLRDRSWTASVQFLNHARSRRVAAPTYRPGADRLIEEDGQPVINLYRPSQLRPAEGDVTPWLEHARYILPDKHARRTVLDWMAYLLQHPERKMNWAVFLGGTQGTGKDALFEPMRLALGDHNTAIVSPDDLASGWTDWLKDTKLVMVQEFAAFEKKALMNRLKSLITSPPTKLRINAKNTPQYYIPNLASFVFFSNYHDALVLEQDDRRFFVYWSPAEPREVTYYQQLYEWMRTNAAAVFAHLLQRDVSNFDAVGHAPMTSDKADVIRDSASPLEQYLRAQFEANEKPMHRDLVVINRLLDHLPEHVGRVSVKAVSQVLRRLGASELPKQLRLPEGRPRVWALRRADLYEQMTEGELTKAFQRQTLGLSAVRDGQKAER